MKRFFKKILELISIINEIIRDEKNIFVKICIIFYFYLSIPFIFLCIFNFAVFDENLIIRIVSVVLIGVVLFLLGVIYGLDDDDDD